MYQYGEMLKCDEWMVEDSKRMDRLEGWNRVSFNNHVAKILIIFYPLHPSHGQYYLTRLWSNVDIW